MLRFVLAFFAGVGAAAVIGGGSCALLFAMAVESDWAMLAVVIGMVAGIWAFVATLLSSQSPSSADSEATKKE